MFDRKGSNYAVWLVPVERPLSLHIARKLPFRFRPTPVIRAHLAEGPIPANNKRGRHGLDGRDLRLHAQALDGLTSPS